MVEETTSFDVENWMSTPLVDSGAISPCVTGFMAARQGRTQLCSSTPFLDRPQMGQVMKTDPSEGFCLHGAAKNYPVSIK